MYRKFKRELIAPSERDKWAYWFVLKNNMILLEKDIDDSLIIPQARVAEELGITVTRTQYLGKYNEIPCYSAECSESVLLKDKFQFYQLRDTYSLLPFDLFQVAGFALQIVTWARDFQFCGRCGSKTRDLEGERAKECPSCGLINYPRISPAAIVAILRDDKILLAKNKKFARPIFSLLAGYVESGESLEECVEREVMEEVGIKIQNVRYFGSQPWPFSHSLMVGYIADYQRGEIVIDEDELVEAGWFSFDNLPPLPGHPSIARQMIDYLKENRQLL